MNKILVPIDFSPTSSTASTFAAALAQEFGAQIHLIHAYTKRAPMNQTDTPEQGLHRDIDALMEQETQILGERFAVRISSHAEQGPADTVILKEAQEQQADLIVMGMKGASRAKSMGSTVFTILRKTSRPLLVVPEEAALAPFQKITFAADFNDTADIEHLDLLLDWIHHFQAEVQVVHVQKTEDMKTSEMTGNLKLERLLSRTAHSYHTIVSSDIELGIHKFLEDHTSTLLVMVTHHRDFFDRLFRTSHARIMSYQTRIPLLVLTSKKSSL